MCIFGIKCADVTIDCMHKNMQMFIRLCMVSIKALFITFPNLGTCMTTLSLDLLSIAVSLVVT